MTKKYFWDDPYATSHQTVVSTVDGGEIELDSTIYFAFSGGQEGDQGTIGGIPVISARKEGLQSSTPCPADHGLQVDQPVEVNIDWTRRYRLMRLHFAAELVLELFYQKLNGVDKVGAHITEKKARIDFAWPESIAPLLPDIAEKANQIIASDLAIQTGFDDISTERRYWEIEGFSRVPCGGTHVRSTAEVGQIRLKRNNIGKGKERVDIFLGEE
jgi:alanyl-tRNA synthetase